MNTLPLEYAPVIPRGYRKLRDGTHLVPTDLTPWRGAGVWVPADKFDCGLYATKTSTFIRKIK